MTVQTRPAPVTKNGTDDAGRLLIVSNRGPFEHYVDRHGEVKRRRASGGLAIALASISRSLPVTWIASAGSAADRRLAEEDRSLELGEDKRLHLVAVAPEAYRLYYGTFCNPILWFLQHGLWHRLQRRDLAGEIDRSWRDGYVPVNQAFARVVVDELRRDRTPDRVMLHDYHLYLTPRFIREAYPDATLQHFVHIPWPGPEAWERLPDPIVRALCEGLLANDSVAFQTQSSALAFMETCSAYLAGAHIDRAQGTVRYAGHRTRVWANPISVDVADLEARLASREARRHRERLLGEMRGRTIVRVDRLDPSKNIVAGFQAYDLLLQRHPEWKRRVVFWAFLVPSRTDIPEYRSYREEVFAAVEAVNRRHGTARWTPIRLFYEHNRPQALAALSLYDVLVVNSVVDGMNLVSKEGAVLNQRDGVLVLSVTAGSFDELGDAALPVEPDDIEGTATMLHRGLTMPAEERRERAARLRQTVLDHDLQDWMRRQLEDLAALRRSGSLAVGR